MNRFLELFRHETSPPPGKIHADERSALFPRVVESSPVLELWAAGRAIPTRGSFLLLGVATWSGYDMKLLEEIEAARPDSVGVFDIDEAQSDDFSDRIPGLVGVAQGPVAGLWKDGRLIEFGSGHDAREIAFRACHLNLDKIADRLDPFGHVSNPTQ